MTESQNSPDSPLSARSAPDGRPGFLRALHPLLLAAARLVLAGAAVWSITPEAGATGADVPEPSAEAPKNQRAPGADAPENPGPPPPFRQALDPVPDDPCSIFAFDGVTLGMPESELSTMDGVLAPPPSDESSDSGRRYVFKARRPGRMDDVRIMIAPDGATVAHIKATIAVAKGDPWPGSIFTVGGNPRKARVTEWIWWSAECGATMRLTKIDPLGGSSKIVPYILEARPFP